MKKAFTPIFLISELNGIQKITLKGFLIGAAILTFSLLNKEAAAQVSGTLSNNFTDNNTKKHTIVLTDVSAIMKVTTHLHSGVLTSDKSYTIPDQNNADSDTSAFGVIVGNSGLSGESKHSFEIGLTKTLKCLYPNRIKVIVIKN